MWYLFPTFGDAEEKLLLSEKINYKPIFHRKKAYLAVDGAQCNDAAKALGIIDLKVIHNPKLGFCIVDPDGIKIPAKPKPLVYTAELHNINQNQMTLSQAQATYWAERLRLNLFIENVTGAVRRPEGGYKNKFLILFGGYHESNKDVRLLLANLDFGRDEKLQSSIWDGEPEIPIYDNGENVIGDYRRSIDMVVFFTNFIPENIDYAFKKVEFLLSLNEDNLSKYTTDMEKKSYCINRQIHMNISIEKKSVERESERRALENARGFIATSLQKIEQINEEIENLEKNRKDSSRPIREYNSITKTNNVVAVKISGYTLKVTTGEITGEWYGVVYRFGTFKIKIDMNNNSIKIINASEMNRNGYPHPHVGRDGNLCLGELSEAVAYMLGNREYDILIHTIIAFLGSISKSQYTDVANWPVVANGPDGQEEEEE